jgi:hypothetical protein
VNVSSPMSGPITDDALGMLATQAHL